ncbi:NAD-binding protein [Thelephora terrestris]|uniref:NAD-binding protein n=1 Tax=Thelephora terrestris TaxID=56493 RepID=A0A9P6L5M9_9AGAM|nr:NAD-binding protein [Thelephora terrestris]
MGQYLSALDVFGRFLYETTLGSYIFVPNPTFTANDVPDLTGKVVIVTGGNTGIGKETCKVLLQKNAKVYLAARNEGRANAAIAELLAQTGKEAIWLELDLSFFQSIESAAAEFHSKETELHILFNNAGLLSPPESLTAEGYDMTFGTNVVGQFIHVLSKVETGFLRLQFAGPYYFTELLLPALYKTSTSENKPRVVNLTSQMGLIGASAFGSGLDFSTFKDSPKRRKMSGTALYSQSKLGNVVYAQEFARRYGDKVISISVHPGPILSELPRNDFDPNNPVFRFFFKLVTYPTPMGAITPLYAGTSPEAENLNGEYLTQWHRVGTPRSKDPVLGKELWTWLEEQVAGREYLNKIRAQIASLK